MAKLIDVGSIAPDVTFRINDHCARERAMANNLSWLRRIAVSTLKRDPAKDNIRGNILSWGYSTDFLTEVLQFQ